MKKQLSGNSLARIFLGGIFTAIFLTATASLALQRVSDDLVETPTNGWVIINPGTNHLDSVLAWIDANWPTNLDLTIIYASESWVTNEIATDLVGYVNTNGSYTSGTNDRSLAWGTIAGIQTVRVDNVFDFAEKSDMASLWDVPLPTAVQGMQGIGVNQYLDAVTPARTNIVCSSLETGYMTDNYDLSTGIFTAPRDGAYRATHMTLIGSTNPFIADMYFRVNGSLAANTFCGYYIRVLAASATTVWRLLSGTVLLELNAGEAVELSYRSDTLAQSVNHAIVNYEYLGEEP